MDFQHDAKHAVTTVRCALANLFVSVRADPSQPQENSRRFRLDKTLTWRLSRVICEDDIWAAAPFIPRRPSIEILPGTLSEHGARRAHPGSAPGPGRVRDVRRRPRR